jgi:hypothetical protein
MNKNNIIFGLILAIIALSIFSIAIYSECLRQNEIIANYEYEQIKCDIRKNIDSINDQIISKQEEYIEFLKQNCKEDK